MWSRGTKTTGVKFGRGLPRKGGHSWTRRDTKWQAYAAAHKLPVSRAIKELAETGRAVTLAGGSIASIKVSNDYILRLAVETLMMTRKLLHIKDPAYFPKAQEAAHKLYAELTGTGKSG